MVDQIRPLRPSIADSYNRYYDSGLYDARYPRPNPSTYRAALQLAGPATGILDFGAGTGRYTLPFLHATDAFVCACDRPPPRAARAAAGCRRPPPAGHRGLRDGPTAAPTAWSRCCSACCRTSREPGTGSASGVDGPC
jgi:SAM-dependent methyltransferase